MCTFKHPRVYNTASARMIIDFRKNMGKITVYCVFYWFYQKVTVWILISPEHLLDSNSYRWFRCSNSGWGWCRFWVTFFNPICPEHLFNKRYHLFNKFIILLKYFSKILWKHLKSFTFLLYTFYSKMTFRILQEKENIWAKQISLKLITNDI